MFALFICRTALDVLAPWLSRLAARLLARAANIPEPLVQSAGTYVFARVQVFEAGVGRRLCPFRLARLIRSWIGRLP